MPDSPEFLLTVDRIEGDRAILDVNGQQVEVPAAALPPGAGEGTLLSLSIADSITDSSAAVTAAAEARLARLRARDTAPDVIDL